MSILDFILALILASFTLILLGFILNFLGFLPAIIVAFISVGFFIALFKFIIGR